MAITCTKRKTLTERSPSTVIRWGTSPVPLSSREYFTSFLWLRKACCEILGRKDCKKHWTGIVNQYLSSVLILRVFFISCLTTNVLFLAYSKFLDPYRISNLIAYLEKLHAKNLAASVRTLFLCLRSIFLVYVYS